MPRIYLDHNATTPVDPEVFAAMTPYFTEKFGNPSSAHSFGQAAKFALDEAREEVAALLHCRPLEVIFTSGGTEANNLALFGAAAVSAGKHHIITTTIEHPAVISTLEELGRRGFQISQVAVDESGVVDPAAILQEIRSDTRLISVMLANNEVGTIQPVQEIAAAIAGRGILLHTDAVQAIGKIPVDVRELAVDFLSLSSHKFYGPKGVGALYIRREVAIPPLIWGGAQERGRRGGTENLPAIVGLGRAAKIVGSRLAADQAHLLDLRQHFETRLRRELGQVVLNGHPEARLVNTVNLSFLGVEGGGLVLSLDMDGVAVSSGSACSSGSPRPSHTLMAMGLGDERARCAVRFSLGRGNTRAELDTVCDKLVRVVTRLRGLTSKPSGNF
jgi:cysteine desulfurase